MKERILTNWSFMRALYLLIGVLIIIHTAMDGQWIGVVFGGFFAAMGLFAFGCASGNCSGGSCSTEPIKNITHQFKI